MRVWGVCVRVCVCEVCVCVWCAVLWIYGVNQKWHRKLRCLNEIHTDGGREIVSNGAASGTQWLSVPTQALNSPQTTFAICDKNIKCPPAIRPRGLVWPWVSRAWPFPTVNNFKADRQTSKIKITVNYAWGLVSDGQSHKLCLASTVKCTKLSRMLGFWNTQNLH